MGVHFMENFDVDSLAAVADRGIALDQTVTSTLASFSENGITRKMISQRRTLNGFAYYLSNAIPIPSSKAFYLSFRLNYPFTQVAFNEMSFTISTVPDLASLSGNNVIASLKPGSSTTFNLYPLGLTTSPFVAVPINRFVTIEVRRDADGTTRVWADDILVYLAGHVSNAPAGNFVYMGIQLVGPTAGGAPYGFDISDVVVVNPATDGLKNRPGSTGRVLSLAGKSDITAEWSAPAGVTTPHYQLMSGYPLPIDTNKILTGRAVGLRETYEFGPIPTGFGTEVLSVGLEQKLSNTGGLPHTIQNEVDVGAGPVAVKTLTLQPGSGYQYLPAYIDKKPDGTNWTAADLTSLKAGLSIVS